jgi:hypothetical protein
VDGLRTIGDRPTAVTGEEHAMPGQTRTKSAGPKTTKTGASVAAFLAAIPDAGRRADCKAVAKLMQKVTGCRPAMWGTSIVGFGSCRYTYAGGRTADWPLCGFSPRKAALTLYVMGTFESRDALMARLGTYKGSKACVYLKRLADVDAAVLEALVKASVARMRATHPSP